jgi:hypothetical protein
MPGIASLFRASARRNLRQGGAMPQYDDLIAKARRPYADYAI